MSDNRGGISINYYRAFLNDNGKKPAAEHRSGKVVSAQQYSQREYTKEELASLDFDIFAEARKAEN